MTDIVIPDFVLRMQEEHKNGVSLRNIAKPRNISASFVRNLFIKYGITRNPRTHTRFKIIEGQIRCYNCKTYKPYIDFAPSQVKLFESGRQSTVLCNPCAKYYSHRKRISAMHKICSDKGISFKCVDCNITDPTKLTIAHVGNFSGRMDVYGNYSDNIQFYGAIVSGLRDTLDLTIKCKNHNILDEFNNGFRKVGTTSYDERIRVLKVISLANNLPLVCSKCGIEDLKLLTKAHKNGGGNMENKIRGPHGLNWDIISGRRTVSDLSIECYNCQDN